MPGAGRMCENEVQESTPGVQCLIRCVRTVLNDIKGRPLVKELLAFLKSKGFFFFFVFWILVGKKKSPVPQPDSLNTTASSQLWVSPSDGGVPVLDEPLQRR